ncbi:MAG: tetratricopeptide repeat-containing protein, partial [Acidobacteria bacterium]
RLAALTALDPRLYLVAHQSLARAYEQRQEWDAAIRAYEAILDHKVLTITVPAASPIYVRALWSISQVLEKTGEAERAAAYREQFRQVWPGKPSTPNRE